MAPRPMLREFDLLKLYPAVQNGRNVSVPDLGLHKRQRNFHKAEAMLAGLIYGSAIEHLEHPRLNKKQAIRIAWDHFLADPNHYACSTGVGHCGAPAVCINPAAYPVMSYGAAHKWEKQAAARGVSKVARSSRGFMRAYQRAGSWSKLPESWKRKRNAFIARHMAQVRKNGEQLWKNGKPSRRALALIMWAYMPPKRRY